MSVLWVFPANRWLDVRGPVANLHSSFLGINYQQSRFDLIQTQVDVQFYVTAQSRRPQIVFRDADKKATFRMMLSLVHEADTEGYLLWCQQIFRAHQASVRQGDDVRPEDQAKLAQLMGQPASDG